MNRKKFDCVEMKRKAQRNIARKTRHMSRREELAYFRAAGIDSGMSWRHFTGYAAVV